MIKENSVDKVANINLQEIFRIVHSSEGIFIPVIDRSGLHVQVHMTFEQAHQILVDLQMVVISWIASQGPQIVSMPKAPFNMEAHSWKVGLQKNKENIILRIEGNNSEIFDVSISSEGAVLMVDDIINLLKVN